ncbi:MAG: N-acetylneuraminate synthase family protein [Bacillota bacterium]
MKEVKIAHRTVGDCSPCFIIAEIGTNHNMSLSMTRELIAVAAEAGVDAIKFQTYHWQDIVHPGIRMSEYGYPSDKPWYQYIEERLSLPREWYPDLFEEARRKGLIPLSTPHCLECADFLLSLDTPAFKVASMELTNTPFLAGLAQIGRPIILSVGMGDLPEISKAIEVIRKHGLEKIVLTHCVSLYPPQPQDINLKNIPALKLFADLPVGFSDHSLGTSTAVAAVALGASVIEKHITLDRKMEGPDHSFAMEPSELCRLVKEIREMELALGSNNRQISQRELANRALYRKSLVAADDIPAGSLIEKDSILITRPGTGISPEYLDIVTGLQVTQKIRQFQPITWDKLKGGQTK